MDKSKIFISHRHSDTQSDCHRLKSDLQEHFGKENVFLDIENLEPGINFSEAIEKYLSLSKVVLVVIGPDWHGPEDQQGVKRLFQSNDWVRREVVAALKSEGTRVIPVLMKKASEPQESHLPDDLKPLAGLQATEITIKRWDYDVGELIKVIERIVPKVKRSPADLGNKPPTRPHNPIPPQPTSWWAKNYLWILGGVVGFMLLIGMCESGGDVIYPEKTEEAGTNVQAGTSGEIQTQNSGGKEINQSHQLENQDPAPSQPSVDSPGYFDVSGQWVLQDTQGNKSILAFSQNGSGIAFYEYNILNVQIGYGSGRVDGNTLYSDYYNTLFEVGGRIEMVTNNSGQSWSGQVIIPDTNTSSNITLTRN